tara:strand:- start:2220 stop:3575 length:1356 start_codon:yes stop_codon:yes gene_type:complete
MNTFFFDNSGAWLTGAVPKYGEDAVVNNNVLLKISKTSISQAGYGKLVVPASSSIEFVTTDTILYLKTLHLRGSVKFLERCSISANPLINTQYTLWHNPDSWMDGKVPRPLRDIIVPLGRTVVITKDSGVSDHVYNYLEIPDGSQLIFDNNATDIVLSVKKLIVNGSILTSSSNQIRTAPKTKNLFLPVYLDSEGKVMDTSANSTSFMDSSFNFVMTGINSSADTLSKFIKYKVDASGVPTFIYNDGERVNFNNQLLLDISNQIVSHYETYFFNQTRNTTNNTIGDMYTQYISDILFDSPSLSGSITNKNQIIDKIVNSRLNEQFTNSIANGLNQLEYDYNLIGHTLYEQLKNEMPHRFENEQINTAYNFPVESGDDISLFVRMSSDVFYNSHARAEDKTHDQRQDGQDDVSDYYNQLKAVFDNKEQLLFNDTEMTVKIKPTTWRVVINLA